VRLWALMDFPQTPRCWRRRFLPQRLPPAIERYGDTASCATFRPGGPLSFGPAAENRQIAFSDLAEKLRETQRMGGARSEPRQVTETVDERWCACCRRPWADAWPGGSGLAHPKLKADL